MKLGAQSEAVCQLLPIPTDRWTCSRLSKPYAGTGPGTWQPRFRGLGLSPVLPSQACPPSSPAQSPAQVGSDLFPRNSTAADPFACPQAHTFWCLWPLKSHQFSFSPLWDSSDSSDRVYRVRRAFHRTQYHVACTSSWDHHGFPGIRLSASPLCNLLSLWDLVCWPWIKVTSKDVRAPFQPVPKAPLIITSRLPDPKLGKKNVHPASHHRVP